MDPRNNSPPNTWVPTVNWGSYEWWVHVCEWVCECVCEWVCMCVCGINDQTPARLLFRRVGSVWWCWCRHRHLFPQALNISCYWVQLSMHSFFLTHTYSMYVYNWTCVGVWGVRWVYAWCHQSLSVGPYHLVSSASPTHTHNLFYGFKNGKFPLTTVL